MSAATPIRASADAVTTPSDEVIAAALMEIARRRGAEATFCPSEATRALAADWRPLMPEVRRVAAGLPLRATRRGRAVGIGAAGGPIRLGLKP